MADKDIGNANFLADAVAIVENGRQAAYATVNQAMIETYWRLGAAYRGV